MKGRNGSTSFLPLNKKGGLITNVFSEKKVLQKNRQNMFMTKLNWEMNLK